MKYVAHDEDFGVADSNKFYLCAEQWEATYRTATQKEKKTNKSLRKFLLGGSITKHENEVAENTKSKTVLDL